jgi:hypothetical protein
MSHIKCQVPSFDFRVSRVLSPEARSPETRSPETRKSTLGTWHLIWDIFQKCFNQPFIYPYTFYQPPNPEIVDCQVSGFGVWGSRNSELGKFGEINKIWFTIELIDKHIDLPMFKIYFCSTYRVPSSGPPNPETRQSRVSGFGGPGTRNLGRFGEINKIWFTIELIGKHIDLPMFEIYFCLHILSSEFRVPDLRTLKPETWQSTILGFGGW